MSGDREATREWGALFAGLAESLITRDKFDAHQRANSAIL